MLGHLQVSIVIELMCFLAIQRFSWNVSTSSSNKLPTSPDLMTTRIVLANQTDAVWVMDGLPPIFWGCFAECLCKICTLFSGQRGVSSTASDQELLQCHEMMVAVNRRRMNEWKKVFCSRLKIEGYICEECCWEGLHVCMCVCVQHWTIRLLRLEAANSHETE